MPYPPKNHPAWLTFIGPFNKPQLPIEPGTYWYDNCWGSSEEEREPMQLTLEYHDEGMGIAGNPEHVCNGYMGLWAPLDWESIKAPEVKAEVESAGFKVC